MLQTYLVPSPPPPKKKKTTPPKFNMEPENDGFQKLISFSNLFQGLLFRFHVEFRGCTPSKFHPIFSVSPRFQPKNGPRDVDKALMQKINSVGCASSSHLREVASERRFLGRWKFSAGRNTHGFSGTFFEAFWGGKSLQSFQWVFLELVFFEIKLLENNYRCCAGLQCLFLGANMSWQFFFWGELLVSGRVPHTHTWCKCWWWLFQFGLSRRISIPRRR